VPESKNLLLSNESPKSKHHKKHHNHTSQAQSSDGKPAILLTGATHARELVTIQMVFNSIFTLLGGVVNGN
jgi:hypothetical protein